MKFITNTIHTFDKFQQRHGVLGFPLAVVKKYGSDQAGYQSALLTYYGFWSLFPLLLVLTTVLQLLLRHESHLRERIITAATTYFPTFGTQLQNNIHLSGKTGLALVIGVLAALYGARGVADAFRNSVNHIWHIPLTERSGFVGSIGRSLGILFFGGLGLIAAAIIAGFITSAGHGIAFRLLAAALNLVVVFFTLLIMTHLALARPVPKRAVWLSAAVAAIGLAILQSVGSLLLIRELKNFNNLYGTFAVVLGLLFWLYTEAQVLTWALETGTVYGRHLWPRPLFDPADTKPTKLA